ncbi:hypothetical protein C8Q70DRAFT_1042378 [Cubamyces menziesii]|uniref:Coiled-coil domain-containing protein 16 n=1 Tax=Trametes cubensis TaxID=1111947 RepID=A0AAD7TMH3_9APHY|nr:hypothetical protein C8Q70DRAFT_1042378 [Cubamyces menziesii]KAJ8469331.1 hypothetical protein ONZ51_g9056 [Trametes cubensis]
MADARALLRAKRQEARIEHPLASYNAAGQLRCIACGTIVKHATAWEGHIGSKTHRTNAARLREERAREEQRLAEEREKLKRKAMDVDEEDEEGQGGQDGEEEEGEGLGGHEPSTKRPRLESTDGGGAGPRDGEPRPASTRASSTAPARSALPADFFSDPSQAPPPPEEDEEDGENGAGAPSADAPQDVLDLEWQQFQASVVNAPDLHETYERATIVAEPELAPEVPQGFPGSTVAGAEEPVEEPEVLDEEALRRKKEQEERELIMDRLVEEEQAQEEADARVTQLKSKLEALKKKREAARAAKKGAKAP